MRKVSESLVVSQVRVAQARLEERVHFAPLRDVTGASAAQLMLLNHLEDTLDEPTDGGGGARLSWEKMREKMREGAGGQSLDWALEGGRQEVAGEGEIDAGWLAAAEELYRKAIELGDGGGGGGGGGVEKRDTWRDGRDGRGAPAHSAQRGLAPEGQRPVEPDQGP